MMKFHRHVQAYVHNNMNTCTIYVSHLIHQVNVTVQCMILSKSAEIKYQHFHTWSYMIRACTTIFMFVPCINSIKKSFIVPTDAHYYKIIKMSEQFTNLKLKHLLRHVLVRAGNIIREQSCASLKLPIWFVCAHRYRHSQCYGGTSTCHAGVISMIL